ncbi:hypothetical protein AMS62_28845 [Bacillus sp. FJAT-18019]|nr:hypothetical protein AMS62_28845 [Bacillus sp. FJAT-18019]
MTNDHIMRYNKGTVRFPKVMDHYIGRKGEADLVSIFAAGKLYAKRKITMRLTVSSNIMEGSAAFFGS